jgi:hypothetical protein
MQGNFINLVLEDKGMKAQIHFTPTVSQDSPKIAPLHTVKIPQEKPISFQEVQKSIEKLLSGKQQATPQSILQTQMICHRYQVQIEMVSKCAEAASSTMKKIQQGGA